MSRLALLAAAAALAVGAAQAQAQAGGTPPAETAGAGALALAVGQTVQRPSLGAGPSVEVFQFEGAAGAKVTVEVVGADAFRATLYTPDRGEMLTIRGGGADRLVAYLPVAGRYLLSVARDNSARPYSLRLTAEAADPATAERRYMTGYEYDDGAGNGRRRMCWVDPGRVRRTEVGGATFEVTELEGGRTRTRTGEGSEYELIWRFKRGEVVAERPGVVTLRFPPLRPVANAVYKGYLCDPPRDVQAAGLTALAPGDKPAAVATAAPAAAPQLPRLTPPPGVLAAEIGKPVSRPAGKPGASIELYQFIGEAGATLDAAAVGAGRYGVTLYTPEGAEMLTATGQGAVKLTAVLPQDAVYILAVARQDGTKPYRLSLAAETPDLHLWNFRQFAGYETLGENGRPAYWTCWVEPGAVMRYNFADGRTQTLRLQRGGAGRWDLTSNGRPAGFNFTTRLDGTRFVRTSDTGQVTSWTLDDPPAKHGAYRGYLCK